MEQHYVRRDIESDIEPFLSRREIIAIVGPRQAGKTTLLTELQRRFEAQGKRVVFLNFEQPTDAILFDHVEDFAQRYCVEFDVVIIDEFHFARDGGKRLKLLFDTHGTKFVISGSSSLELTFQTGKYLVGRYIPFVLFPFSFREYLRATTPNLARVLDAVPSPFDASFAALGGAIDDEIEGHFATYAITGGYPSVVLTTATPLRQQILRALYDAYLLKDIRDLLQLATERELQVLTHLLAGQIGNLMVYQELASAANLAQPMVKRHLHILEQTYVLELLRPFFRNSRLEVVKNPKVYFLDGGFRNAVLRAWAPLATRADAGAIVEQAVFVGLRRAFPRPTMLSFWRSKSGAEVDFVVEQEGVPIPIEVKYQRDPKLGKSFRSFLDRYAPPRAYLATRGTFSRTTVGRTVVTAAPAWYWA